MNEFTGFDNEKYLEEQTVAILKRAEQNGNKLYLEFGGNSNGHINKQSQCFFTVCIWSCWSFSGKIQMELYRDLGLLLGY